VKIGGSFNLQPYLNSPPIFHWAQAVPTRNTDRSHWRSEYFNFSLY